MLSLALDILEEDLNTYLSSIGYPARVRSDNVAKWDIADTGNSLEDRIILSLLKTEEEVVLKNTPAYKNNDSKYEVVNPPVHLNLYVIFSANLENYKESLSAISRVIEFFQGKRIFTAQNTAYRNTAFFEDEADSSVRDFKLSVHLFTPSFDELNSIWSIMGGKQFPSVFYKIQLVKINQKKKLAESPGIIGIKNNLKTTGR